MPSEGSREPAPWEEGEAAAAPRGRWCTATPGPALGCDGHTVSFLSETVSQGRTQRSGLEERGRVLGLTPPCWSCAHIFHHSLVSFHHGLKNYQVNIFSLKICQKSTNLGEKMGRSEHSALSPR